MPRIFNFFFLSVLFVLGGCAISRTGIEKKTDDLTGLERSTVTLDLIGRNDLLRLTMTRETGSQKIKSATLRVKEEKFLEFQKTGALKVKVDGKIFSFNVAPERFTRSYTYFIETEINPGSLDEWKNIAFSEKIIFQANGINSQLTKTLGPNEIIKLQEFVAH